MGLNDMLRHNLFTEINHTGLNERHNLFTEINHTGLNETQILTLDLY